jgi:hypothetical protein
LLEFCVIIEQLGGWIMIILHVSGWLDSLFQCIFEVSQLKSLTFNSLRHSTSYSSKLLSPKINLKSDKPFITQQTIHPTTLTEKNFKELFYFSLMPQNRNFCYQCFSYLLNTLMFVQYSARCAVIFHSFIPSAQPYTFIIYYVIKRRKVT